MSGELGLKKRYIQSPSRMNSNAQEDLPLLKSTEMEKKVCLSLHCEISKKTDLILRFCSYFFIFISSRVIIASLGLLGVYRGAFGGPGSHVGVP